MIRKFENKDKLRVNALGKSLSSSYDVINKGENDEILVYDKEGVGVIGFMQYSKLYEVADILYIVVDERFRKRGIGSYFLTYLSDDADIKKFMLEVRESNITAIKFYEDYGFKKVRPIENYYKNGESAFSMEKVIR